MLEAVDSIGAGGVGDGDGTPRGIGADGRLDSEVEDTGCRAFLREADEFDFADLDTSKGEDNLREKETVALVGWCGGGEGEAECFVGSGEVEGRRGKGLEVVIAIGAEEDEARGVKNSGVEVVITGDRNASEVGGA